MRWRHTFLLLPLAFLALLAVAPDSRAASGTIDLEPHLRRDGYQDLSISPQGQFYAATVMQEDRSVLVVIRRADKARTATFTLGRNSYVSDFLWASEDRLLVTMAERFGVLEHPQPTGEIFGVNTDGSRAKLLFSRRAGNNGDEGAIALALSPPSGDAAFLLDALPADPKAVLVTVWPMGDLPMTHVAKMDVDTGNRTTVALAPVPRASFTVDGDGEVRFASGAKADNLQKLYFRSGKGAEWKLLNDEATSGLREYPMGFSADGATAYLEVQARGGPNQVVAMDIASGKRTTLLGDPTRDPWRVLRATGATREPVGVLYGGNGVRAAFFDEAGKQARLHRTMERALAGQAVRIHSSTDDGNLVLVSAWSATNPGDYFLFDVAAGQADRVLGQREWIDPSKSAPVEFIRFNARDGLLLDGMLTSPAQAKGPMPMVIVPHGGPFGVFETWEYDEEAQVLAQAGYRVLKVNFRGSGDRGRDFEQAGAREWGGKMQDDITDATQWAIKQGLADPGRICLAGASYGAYAAMMGLAREPDLYRCGIGYVGVYDLERMARDDTAQGKSSATWVKQWVGEGDALRAASPTSMADRIKAPVLLVAGGRDEVAPIAHSRAMQRELKRAGVPVETLYVSSEGHGFFAEENRRKHYTAVLEFLSRHLGGAKAQ